MLYPLSYEGGGPARMVGPPTRVAVPPQRPIRVGSGCASSGLVCLPFRRGSKAQAHAYGLA